MSEELAVQPEEQYPCKSNRSDSLLKFAPAMAKAQSEIGAAHKDSANPFFKSSYADLSSIWDACRKALTDNGFSVLQPTFVKDNKIFIETLLLHSSEEWVSGIFEIKPEKDTPQGVGSALTYARRYTLAAMVGVAPADDDAEGAMRRDDDKKPSSADHETACPTCPQCGHSQAVIKGKQEYGGGLICFKKKGGCGYSWQTNSQSKPPMSPPQSKSDWESQGITKNQNGAIFALFGTVMSETDKNVIRERCASIVGIDKPKSIKTLTFKQAADIIDHLNSMKKDG